MPGVFNRRSTRRGVLMPTSSLSITVKSETELRGALAALASTNPAQAGDLLFAPRGGEIVIGGSFGIKAPVNIPPQCAFITIRSAGYVPVFPLVAMSTMFTINALGVSLLGLFCSARSLAVFCTTFATVGSESFAGDNATVDGCLCYTDRIFVEGTSAAAVTLTNNKQEHISATHAAPIEVSGEAYIAGNWVKDGGGDVILLAGSDDTRVMGNHCNGGDITSTNAVNSRNVIVGNSNVGTVNSASITDAVGLNT